MATELPASNMVPLEPLPAEYSESKESIVERVNADITSPTQKYVQSASLHHALFILQID